MSGFRHCGLDTGRTLSAVTTTPRKMFGCDSRRLTLTMAWLGTAALVVGGSTTAASAAPAVSSPAPLLGTLAKEAPVAGEYIVVLKSDTTLQAQGLRASA